MNKEIVIQPMLSDDIPKLLEIWKNTPGVSLRKRDDSFEKLNLFLCRNPDYCFTAKGDEVVIGGVLCGSDTRRAIIYHTVVLKEYRNMGVGTRLMQTIEAAARACGARMLVLETQTCNERAIAFYKKHGFSLIGFDLYSYSNDDPKRCEVRIEMGKKLIVR